MEEVEVPNFSIFVEHGHLLPGGTGWEESNVLWYQGFITPEGAHGEDDLQFAYGASVDQKAKVSRNDGSESEEKNDSELNDETLFEEEGGEENDNESEESH